ncbi:hypothetical protein NA56DRAFT_38128 [Hyaloscypha hepaticicola]|uniref:Uncharacterized protein n=1 Tax=Hyaloscypha hepaticicola TaxID=2082293 RepID=A0A2J6PDK3_9HELO|nr:hypothetical protein NA56DRAFT_38128 [Hyaloscypha hepaticicola]
MKGNKWETWNKQDGEAQIEKWESGIDLKLATDTEIREYTDTKLYERLLRSFGVNVLQGDNLSIAQSLVDVPRAYEQGTYVLEGYDKPVGPNAPKALLVDALITPPPQAPIDLPFASFRQESIPLHLQYKELPEERQQRLRQQQKRPQNRPKAQPAPKSRCLPQPSTCRHCKENFGSRNALFRHLGLQNVSIPSILGHLTIVSFLRLS